MSHGRRNDAEENNSEQEARKGGPTMSRPGKHEQANQQEESCTEDGDGNVENAAPGKASQEKTEGKDRNGGGLHRSPRNGHTTPVHYYHVR